MKLSAAISTESAKVAYPVGVATAVAAGVTLDDIVKLTAILAALASFGYTAWKWWREAHRAKRERACVLDKVTIPADKP
jgi:hypothetical protein